MIKAAILSIVGWHAGESVTDIIARKTKDIEAVGFTVWLYHSWLASRADVQDFASQIPDLPVLFVTGKPYPTSASIVAQCYSEDQTHWTALPKALGPVTGKLPAFGLILDRLEAVDAPIDTWDYVGDYALCKSARMRYNRSYRSNGHVGSLSAPLSR